MFLQYTLTERSYQLHMGMITNYTSDTYTWFLDTGTHRASLIFHLLLFHTINFFYKVFAFFLQCVFLWFIFLMWFFPHYLFNMAFLMHSIIFTCDFIHNSLIFMWLYTEQIHFYMILPTIYLFSWNFHSLEITAGSVNSVSFSPVHS